jgi:hypothetical protein
VKVLTKYQAEKKICWYHWEVVDGYNCNGPDGCGPACGCEESADNKCPCVYKAAPADAQIGQQIELSPSDRAELVSYIAKDGEELNVASQLDVAGSPVHAAERTQQPAPTTDTSDATASQQESTPSLWQRCADLLPTSKWTR